VRGAGLPALFQPTEIDAVAQFEKHFTVEEARSSLPDLRRRFAQIHALYAELGELQEAFQRVQELVRMNGHAPKDTGFEVRALALKALVQEIIEAGVEIKDVNRGLVDFPHWRDGEEVFLCWQLGEDDLLFWHRIEDGFAGRQPL
jgi:hypothetical protein